MPKKTGGMGLNGAIGALERARKSLEIAENIIDMDLASSANRIYNAGENIATAVLLSLSLSVPKSHGKIWNAMNLLHKKGILSADYKPLLEQSYRIRIKGDYGRDLEGKAVSISYDILAGQIESLKSFLKEAESIINKQSNNSKEF